ncbi:Rab3 GTPase-activating protein catalytic subunit [Pseudoscourfieldia marina]
MAYLLSSDPLFDDDLALLQDWSSSRRRTMDSQHGLSLPADDNGASSSSASGNSSSAFSPAGGGLGLGAHLDSAQAPPLIEMGGSQQLVRQLSRLRRIPSSLEAETMVETTTAAAQFDILHNNNTWENMGVWELEIPLPTPEEMQQLAWEFFCEMRAGVPDEGFDSHGVGEENNVENQSLDENTNNTQQQEEIRRAVEALHLLASSGALVAQRTATEAAQLLASTTSTSRVLAQRTAAEAAHLLASSTSTSRVLAQRTAAEAAHLLASSLSKSRALAERTAAEAAHLLSTSRALAERTAAEAAHLLASSTSTSRVLAQRTAAEAAHLLASSTSTSRVLAQRTAAEAAHLLASSLSKSRALAERTAACVRTVVQNVVNR